MAIVDNACVTVPIVVPDTGAPVEDAEVTIDNLQHTYDEDLNIRVNSAEGTDVILSNANGGNGDNYVGTNFWDGAATSITTGTAPFTGNFRPQQPLANLDGEQAEGTWDLIVCDTGSDDTGQVVEWSVTLPDGPSGFGVNPASKSFGDQTVGTQSSMQTFTVTNTGFGGLHVTNVQLAGADSGQFSLGSNTCASVMVESGATCTVQVAFKPTSAGSKTANLTFTDDAPGSPQSVALSGTGVAAPAPTLPAKPTGVKGKATTKKVTSSWKAASGASGYKVELKSKDKKGKKVARSISTTKTSATFTVKLKKNTKAKVCVASTNVAGSSAQSCITAKVK